MTLNVLLMLSAWAAKIFFMAFGELAAPRPLNTQLFQAGCFL